MEGEGVFQSDLHALLAISPSKKRTVGLKAITFELTYCWYGPYSRGPIYRGAIKQGGRQKWAKIYGKFGN